jgi:transposase InsO family protein
MQDELLNGEIFYSLREAQIIIERWRNHYNTKRPHSALGYPSHIKCAIRLQPAQNRD